MCAVKSWWPGSESQFRFEPLMEYLHTAVKCFSQVCVSIEGQTLNLIICRSPSGRDHGFESCLVSFYKPRMPWGVFRFCHTDPIKLCWIEWGASVRSHLQVSSQMFCTVCALKGSQRTVLNPFLGWTFWEKANLLHQSLCTLKQGFGLSSITAEKPPRVWCCHLHAPL